MQKIFQNLLFICTVILVFKILINLDEKIKEIPLILYFISFLPSLFLFSSIITKDLPIILMISIIFFSLFRINKINKTNLMLMLLSSIALFYIYSVRYWVALSIIISVLTYITIKFIRIFFKNKTYQVSFC